MPAFIVLAVVVFIAYTAAIVVITAAIAIVLWDPLLEPILAAIMSIFGITDEDIISTDVSSQRILTDESAPDALSMLALMHQDDPDATVIEKLMKVSSSSRVKFTNGFNYAEDGFVDGLPDCSFRARHIDPVVLKDIIDTETGGDVTILTYEFRVPTKTEYVYDDMEVSYDLTPSTGEFPYMGTTFTVSNIDYNYTTDNYDVYGTFYEDITTETTTTTTVTVTNIDATTDNVNTVVTERTVVTGTVNGVTSDSTIELSNTDEVVDIDTVVDSVTTDVVSVTDYDVVAELFIYSILAHAPFEYYIVQYEEIPGDWSYWLYSSELDTYPELEGSSVYASQLDMLPVITLRNNTIDVNSDKESEEYLSSKKMCDLFGIDIDYMIDSIAENPDIDNVEDTFIHFGISPSDQDPVISDVLFNTFNHIYEDTDLMVGETSDSTYMATFAEGAMNMGLAWTNQSRVSNSGIIGPVGTYTHSVTSTTLVMNYQGAEEQYITITINNVNTVTFIDRQGLWGTTSLTLDDENFSIPLSYQYTTSLSPIKQTTLMVKSLRLSFYSADVQHLEWYETEAFAPFMKILAVIIVIATTIFSAGTGTPWASIALDALINLTIAVGISLALETIFKATDNVFIRAIAVAVAIVVGAYAAGTNVTDGFMTAQQLTNAVTEFSISNISGIVSNISAAIKLDVAIKFEDLAEEMEAFEKTLEVRAEELTTAEEELEAGLGIEYIADLSIDEPVVAYLEGVDAMMYRAVGIQYDYDVLYDYGAKKSDYYDIKLQVGIV